MPRSPAPRAAKPATKPKAAPAAKPSVVPTIRLTTETAARIIGVGDRQLRNLRQQGCPLPDGGIRTIADIAAIVAWRMESENRDLRERIDDLLGDEDGGMSRLEYEDKRTALKAKQLKLARELNLVLDEDEYLHHLSVLWAEMNSMLDSMGTQLAPLLAPLSDEFDIADRIDVYVADIKGRFNPEEAMNPVRVDLDPFTDDEVGIDLEDDGDADDDEA